MSAPTKRFELETRIARLELTMNDIKGAMELLTKRTLALRAELDHLTAKLGAR